MKHSSVWLLLAGTLAACDSPTDPLQLGSTLDPDGARIEARHETVTAAAAGAAIRFVTLGDGSELKVLTDFDVKRYADDSAKGWFHYRAGVVEITVDVTCMTVVDGHKAWIAGVISETTVGFLGHVSYFYTFDNGEGAKADADIVSQIRVEATPGLGEDQRFCDELPDLLTPFPIAQGNVNVRG